MCQQCLDFSHRGSKKPHLKINLNTIKKKTETKVDNKNQEIHLSTQKEQKYSEEQNLKEKKQETLKENEINEDFDMKSIDYNNRDILVSFIFSLHFLREFEKINLICEKFLETNPKDKLILCFYGEALANIKKPKKDGTVILQQLITTEPDDINEMFAFAKANMILKNNETMIFWLKTAAQNGDMYAQFTLGQCKLIIQN